MSRATSDWLGMHASFRPEAEALVDVDHGGRRFTYAQLHDLALRWSGRLSAEGVGRGDVVALLAQNRAEHLALLFACAEWGAVFFPVNWRLSAQEITWQLDHCGARLRLVGDGFELPGAASVDAGPQAEPTPGPGAELGDPWVLMYTSGSTGKPKGALLTHQQLHWNAINTVLACDLAPGDCTLTFTPLFHTGGLNCLTTPLLHRGAKVVLTQGVDPSQALELIGAERVTLLMGVPTIFQMLADHPRFQAADLSSVRDALCGGAPLQVPLLQRWLDRGVPLRQGFGMTEVGPNCFSMPPADVRRKLGSVGKPIHHMGWRLVRPDGSDAGVDEPGELHFSGPAVFGGYLGQAPQSGWFATGDVLSRDADGFFTVRGRLKEMFISGGENVYPAEVEAALLQCDGVGQAAVVGVPDARWGEVGRAFVEPAPNAKLDPEGLRRALEPRLARFKIPKTIIVGPLPRTPSGKIDKATLKENSP